MNNTVSIIVPVYNSEKYLARCINSILNQTYKEIELILIDDGSTDQSGFICDQFAKKDNRIIVEHQENFGVSNARNVGIGKSSGEFLQFVDSDDYISSNMTEVLFNAIKYKDEVDMVICGYNILESSTGNCLAIEYSKNEEKILGIKEFLNIFDELYENLYLHLIWNKIFRRRVIKENNIVFEPKLDLGEDLIFNLEAIKYCRNVVIVPSSPYYYVQYDSNGENLTSKYRENVYENQKLLMDKVMDFYPGKYKRQINNIEKVYSGTLISYAIMHIVNNIDLIDFQLFKEKVERISGDKIFIRKIKHINVDNEKKLIRFFISYNMYTCFYIYAKVRKEVKRNLPILFRTLKRLKYFGKCRGKNRTSINVKNLHK